MYQYPKLNDKIYYWFSVNDINGTAIDGSNTNIHVRSAGSPFSASPIVTLQPDLLTSTAYSNGSYEVLIQLDGANNFETGNSYGVYANAYVSSTAAPNGFIGGFTIDNPIHSNIKQLNDDTQAAINLANSALSITIGKAEAGTLSTTQMTTDVAEATDNHYKGKVLTWTSGVLFKQSSNVSAYLGSAGMFTFAAVTDIPAAGDSFVVT